jgi:UDP-2-acetamido-3-amino-2,3-dideoxy-glucuronate N-acetyltransferase
MKEPVIIHPTSDVRSDKIEDNTIIWQFCVICKGARIGKNCNISANVFIEGDVVIGSNVTIKCGVQLWDGITILDDAFIGPNVTFSNDLYPRSKSYSDAFLTTVVGKGASIGANATILPGINIGDYSMIAAGSVVTKDVPKHALFKGLPAKQSGWVCCCGKKVTVDTCHSCHTKFNFQQNK